MTKNGEPHIVHLPEQALAELAQVQARQDAAGLKTPFVFTTTGVTPASGVSRAKLHLDGRIVENGRNKVFMTSWSIGSYTTCEDHMPPHSQRPVFQRAL
jgi:hypothetical protein